MLRRRAKSKLGCTKSDEALSKSEQDSSDENQSDKENKLQRKKKFECDEDSDYEPAEKKRRGRGSGLNSKSLQVNSKVKSKARAKGKFKAEMLPSGEDGAKMEGWREVDEADVAPCLPTFRPLRTPGPQLIMMAPYTALDLFQLFFTKSALQTIVKNTNENGRAHCSTKYHTWTDITLKDMYSFLSLVIYMGFVKCCALTDYWRCGTLYDLPFPRKVMSGNKWLGILQALKLSSLEDDAKNEKKKGTPEFDCLANIKPLYDDIREACRHNYQPRQEMAVDVRMVASKAKVPLKKFMKNKSVHWGFKLFVLADCSNGYTYDFLVYEGESGKALSDTVMSLINPSILGSGYKLYLDNIYTTPSFFRDLLKHKILACGTVRPHGAEFSKVKLNVLDQDSPRGSIRWLRSDSVLFLQWRDTKDIFLCSTIHPAHANKSTNKKTKNKGGRSPPKAIPPSVKDHSRCMVGVSLSDSQIGYYQVLRKTRKWYTTFFYHFVDIAAVNAYFLYEELCKAKGELAAQQKVFRELLVEQLFEAGTERATAAPPQAPEPTETHHRLVYLTSDWADGWQKCKVCKTKTPVKCSSCNIPLCFSPQRDCYNDWHTESNK
ncbi:piggyBac transposable element-derived protein 4-like [Poecilia reticulata]|uniref:piggyBac transposable element-derived protein 4-like n=1 Tax=Poecilia reticulata TaxID=8081 RepID=UPI0004A4BD06|nr:PREDICTED: piggyBac transposable element-derived protein 4-like [Poecilia reticulata]XP_017157521.1 PREDICTED: piggyBac transposable element-derived protein 4-like [Poecilia reticulata]